MAKAGDDKPVNKINKIQSEKYKRKNKKTANKFHLNIIESSPEYAATDSAKIREGQHQAIGDTTSLKAIKGRKIQLRF